MSATIILVDDHPVFRQGLRSLLTKEKDLKVVAEADDGQMAVELVGSKKPDLVIMDINMPNMDGIEATRKILSDCPATRVMVLSVHSRKHFVREMIQAGVSGYILKESIPEEMVAGIRTVLSGNVYLSKSISDILVSDYKTLAIKSEPEPDETELPVLYTKLHRPPISAKIIPRTHLIERLDQSASFPMTLITAPAGYGKSILASQWLEVSEMPGGWVSLDEKDNDLRVFLSYVLQAVHTIFPDHELKTRSLLMAANLQSVRVIARFFLNDLETMPRRFILVIDDYHYIYSSPVHDLLSELLMHPSSKMHLVLVTRRDPPLALTSLRSRGGLNEITTEDLRFSVSETKSFLERFLQITISDVTVQVLEDKTEGWVTGLYLAALSIRSTADQKQLTNGLPETFHFVRDYLIHEVLAHVPQQFNRYLLRTAILKRFCAPLCDAITLEVTKQESTRAVGVGQDFIDWLIETNLFITPLDTVKQWFRYHHLFQEILKNQLEKHTSKQEISMIHIQAGEWFESQGLITESIEYMLVAGNPIRAAEIVERYRFSELDKDRFHVLKRWLDMLPAEIKWERPGLLLAQGWMAFFRLDFTQVPSILEQVDTMLGGKTPDPILLGELHFFRGMLQFYAGDVKNSQRNFEKGLAQIQEKQLHVMCRTEYHLALARHMSGQKASAIQLLEDRIQAIGVSKGLHPVFLIGGLVWLQLLSGELAQGKVQARRMQSVLKKSRHSNTEVWAFYLQACCDFHSYDLDGALQYFTNVVEQRYVIHPVGAIQAFAGLVLTHQLMQQPNDATEAMDGFTEFAQELNIPDYLSVSQSCKARLSLLQGDLVPAVQWTKPVSEIPPPMALNIWLEVPVTTQARVWIADGTEASLVKAIELLQTLRQLAQTYWLTNQTIEIAVLQSLALEKQGHTKEALVALKEALDMAETGGWIRPFVELGAPMANMLTQLSEEKFSVDFWRKLVAAFDNEKNLPEDAQHMPPAVQTKISPTISAKTLVDSLTNREMDVLELLTKRYQTKEIANKLSVSPETVKSHLKNIYQKLNVSDRRKAVKKARQLGVI